MKHLLLLVFFSSLIFCCSGCTKTKPAQVTTTVTKNATLYPEVTAEFVQFHNDIDFGRVADFTINNGANITIRGFRGTIIGENASGETVYEIPWSKVAIPEISKPNSKATLDKLGLQIPDDVTEMRLVFKEFDLLE